jgi:RsiW-degrading membrane proteinase PrsW (M82 family)
VIENPLTSRAVLAARAATARAATKKHFDVVFVVFIFMAIVLFSGWDEEVDCQRSMAGMVDVEIKIIL